jgi:hypothetical protein
VIISARVSTNSFLLYHQIPQKGNAQNQKTGTISEFYMKMPPSPTLPVNRAGAHFPPLTGGLRGGKEPDAKGNNIPALATFPYSANLRKCSHP